MVIQQVMHVSNNLYGNDIVSSYELAKGYTIPLTEDRSMLQVPKEKIDAHNVLKAKRKLNLILRAKSVNNPSISIGDLVDVFIKLSHQKRGKWTGPKKVLSVNLEAQSITYAGKRGKKCTTALEDVRVAIENGSLAKHIQLANNELDNLINENTDSIESSNDSIIENRSSEEETEIVHEEPEIVHEINIVPEVEHEANMSEESEPAQILDNVSLEVGNRVKVFWPDDNRFYEGTIVRNNSRTGTHTVEYDDGEKEVLNMEKEQYELVGNNETADETFHDAVDNEEPITANNVEMTPMVELESESESVVKSYRDHFGFKEFTSSQAQGLPCFVLHNAYNEQEKSYLNHVRKVHVSKVPKMANIISSHTTYKVK